MIASPSSRRLPATVRRLAAGAACLAAVILVFLVFTKLSAPSALWSPRLVDHPGYSPADPAVVQEAWPELGTATGLGGKLTAWSRTVLGGTGRRVGVDPAGFSSVAGTAAVLLVVVAVRQLGGGLLAAIASALGLGFGGLFWSRTTGAQPATYAALFALGTLSALLWWQSSRRWSAALVAVGCLAVTVAVQPVAIAGLPVILLFVWRGQGQAARGQIAVAGMFVVAAAASALSAWESLGGEVSLSPWLLPGGVSDLVDRLSATGGIAVSDFGVLGLAFLAAGCVALWLGRTRIVLVLFAGWSAAVVLGGLIWAAPDWRTSVLPALSPAWVVVGLGMHWMLAPVEGRRPSRAALALVALLPVMSFAGHHWVGTRAASARQLVEASLEHLDRQLPSPPVVIAEGGTVDRVVSSRGSDGEDGWRRVAQDPERVEQLVEAGVPVVGFAGARVNLEELGFRFVPVGEAGVPMTLDEVIDTVPPGWIVAIAGGPGLVRALGPEAGPAFAAIGGAETLFGARTARYAIIGVKGGRGGSALEQRDSVRAELSVATGETLRQAFRAPAAIRVTSTEAGGSVEYGGREVAATSTGAAVAIVSATGELAGAYGIEYEEGLRVPVAPTSLRPARVVGREPCVSVGADGWTDVTRLGRYGSFGALLDRGQVVELYVGAAHALNLRQAALGHRRVPTLAVARAEAVVDAGLPAALAELPFVYHVRVVAAGARRSQLALRFGGFAEVAVARVSAAGGRAVVACSAMRGGSGLFARAGSRRQAEDLDLANGWLFPYGWGRLEGVGRRGVRWTRAREAEMLLPLAQTGRFVLEIEAQPVGSAETMLFVEVNDTALEAVSLDPGPGVYRWEVPEDVWRAGMNRVRVRTPTLHRPSEVVGNHDDRLLGLGVSRVRLRPTAVAERPGPM